MKYGETAFDLFYLIFAVAMGIFAIVIIFQLIYNYYDKSVYAETASAQEGGDQA